MADNETIADIIAEMRIFKCRNLETGELESCNAIANYLADRLEAAHKRERGDCAKLREALETLRELLGDLLRLGDAEYHDDFSNFCDIIDAALSAPPRNCDVGTAEEQVERWNNENPYPYEWDDRQYLDTKEVLNWAQMPYEEGGDK